MGIGAGIFLMAVGAILKFAITADVNGVDIQTIGTILIWAGAAVSVISLVLYAMSRGRVDHHSVATDSSGRVVAERHDRVDSPPVDTRF
jgi:hypothetical protein